MEMTQSRKESRCLLIAAATAASKIRIVFLLLLIVRLLFHGISPTVLVYLQSWKDCARCTILSNNDEQSLLISELLVLADVADFLI